MDMKVRQDTFVSPYYNVPEKQNKVGKENKPIIVNQQTQTCYHKIYGSVTIIQTYSFMKTISDSLYHLFCTC